MAKVISLDLSETTAQERTRVQEWFFNAYGKSLNLADSSEVTQNHIIEYLEKHLKSQVRTYERRANQESFISSFTDLILES